MSNAIKMKPYHPRLPEHRNEDNRRGRLMEVLFWERKPESAVTSAGLGPSVMSRGGPSHESRSFGEKLDTYPSAKNT